MEARLKVPRVAPLDPEDWTEAQAKILGPVYEQAQLYNNLGTLARHGQAFERLMAWGGHVINGSTLGVRDRELIILRIGWLCKSHYIWRQHRVISMRDGFTEADLVRIENGPEAEGWAPNERLVLRAVDEVHADAFISDDTWAGLAKLYTTEQVMDIIMAAGTYAMMAGLLNSLGVQMDEGFREDDPLSVRSGLVME